MTDSDEKHFKPQLASDELQGIKIEATVGTAIGKLMDAAANPFIATFLEAEAQARARHATTPDPLGQKVGHDIVEIAAFKPELKSQLEAILANQHLQPAQIDAYWQPIVAAAQKISHMHMYGPNRLDAQLALDNAIKPLADLTQKAVDFALDHPAPPLPTSQAKPAKPAAAKPSAHR